MSLTIPAAIAAILPLLATMLSSYLNDDHLKPGTNALIALAAILITATACEVLAGNVTGNWAASFIGVLGYVGVLMNGDLATLYGYLVAKPSPLAPPAPARSTPTASVVTKAYTPPTPLVLSQGASPVPQRASAPTDTTPGA